MTLLRATPSSSSHVWHRRAVLRGLVVLVLGLGSGLVDTVLLAQSSEQSSNQADDNIEVYFRNNKARFKSVAVVYYSTGDSQGTVVSRFLLPWQRFKITGPLGTKLFVVDEAELREYQAGQDLRERDASITFREDDDGKVFDIYKVK